MPAGKRRYWEKTKDRWLLIMAILFSLLFMAADQTPPVLSAKRGVGRVMSIFRRGMNWLPDLVTLKARHREVLVRLGQYAVERNRYHEAKLENQQLRRLLGFTLRGRLECIPAEVIGRGAVGIAGTVHLDVGWRQGIRKNMALFTERGVVGQIVSVSVSSSVGLLLTDVNCRVSARVQRSRVLGIVRWLTGDVCLLEGVPLRNDVRIGDLVVTSGYGDIYPPGLPVGTVFEVSPDEEGLFQKVLLRTEVDMTRLEHVLALNKNGDEEGAAWKVE